MGEYRIWILAGIACLAIGCGGAAEEEVAAPEPTPVRRATAYIDPTKGNEMIGTAIFINESTSVDLQIHLEQAPPGEHAVHLHEIGDCSAEDGTSAGGHWNPSHAEHGKWGEEAFHLGDIGNVTVGADGIGDLTFKSERWTMGSGQENDIMGKAVIVHAQADDFTTQPTGAAGGRIGCGVIK